MKDVFEKTREHLLSEMAMAQIQNKKFLNVLKSGDINAAVDAYINAGGEIGYRKQPRRTITTFKAHVAAGDPRYEGITDELINKFEEELMKRHEEQILKDKGAASEHRETAKAVEASVEKKPEPAEKETAGKVASAAPATPVAKAPVEEPKLDHRLSADKEIGTYLATFKKEIVDEFGPKLIKDFKQGYVIPKEYRDDREWINMSLKMFNPDKHGGLSYTTQFKRPEDTKKVRPASGPAFEKYMSRFENPAVIRDYGDRIKAAYEAGDLISIPDSADDEEEARIVKKFFDGPTRDKSDLKKMQQIDAVETREARQRVKTKEAKSTISKNKESDYDKYGYPKDLKSSPETERRIKDLVKQASLLLDTKGNITAGNEKKLVDIAEKILSLKKAFSLSTEGEAKEGSKLYNDKFAKLYNSAKTDKDKAKLWDMLHPEDEVKNYRTEEEYKQMAFEKAKKLDAQAKGKLWFKLPDHNDEFYPMAKALVDYKSGKGNENDFKKLVLGIRRIGTHDEDIVRGKAVKRLDDETSTALSELKNVKSIDDPSQLKVLAKEVTHMYDFTKARKPLLSDFRKKFGAQANTFEYFNALNSLWKAVYEDKNPSVEDMKKNLLYIKKEGILNITDLKWAGERKEEKALTGRENDQKVLAAKLKESIKFNAGIIE